MTYGMTQAEESIYNSARRHVCDLLSTVLIGCALGWTVRGLGYRVPVIPMDPVFDTLTLTIQMAGWVGVCFLVRQLLLVRTLERFAR
jgi:hypothetical protein